MQPNRTLAEWQNLILEQNKSGLNKIEFCKQKGINSSRFYYYRKLLKETNKESISEAIPSKEISLIPVKINHPKLKATEKEINIRFILKNKLECILPNGLENKRMKEIIEVLLSC